MDELVKRMEQRNADAVSDMNIEAQEGTTCGAPHRAVVRGIAALGENMVDLARAGNGKKTVRLFGKNVEIFRVVLMAAMLYMTVGKDGVAWLMRLIIGMPQPATLSTLAQKADANETAEVARHNNDMAYRHGVRDRLENKEGK